MLLEIDGLDAWWESGVGSDWDGHLGLFDAIDVLTHVPFAIRRLIQNSIRHYDSNTMV